ncbi:MULTISPECIES: hypothetical protein [unclassified Mycoplasma]|uniref:hypothetical protein n=1 Tax=unclassified Mycoplasma TaxID=2683645 RepID=UPI000FDD42F4
MTITTIVLLIFVALVICLASGAVGLALANERGRSRWWGLVICFCLPLIGQILYLSMPKSDKTLVEEVYERQIIDRDQYEKTREFLREREKKESS